MPDEVINPDSNDTDTDLDILNSDTPEPDKEKPKAPKEKVEDKPEIELEEEEDPLENEDEDEQEEEEEEVEDIPDTRARPSMAKMLEKAPELKDIFKKVPQLRDAYFREAKFSQLFPDIEDAQEASEKADAMDVFNDAVMSGSSREILEAIRKDSPEMLSKFVSNFLPTLSKLDNDLFYKVSVPIVDRVIVNLFKTGQAEKDQNQMAAAKILNKFLHNSYEINEPRREVDPELDAERKKLDKDRNDHARAISNEFETNVHERTGKLLNKVVTQGLDPENGLSELVKSTIVEKTIERVGAELTKDAQLQSKLNKLWKGASSSRFSQSAADSIISAYLSRAKQLIPEIRTKLIREATGIRSRTNGNGTGKTTRRDNNVGSHSGRSSGKGPVSPKDVNWRKTSDMDLLKD